MQLTWPRACRAAGCQIKRLRPQTAAACTAAFCVRSKRIIGFTYASLGKPAVFGAQAVAIDPMSSANAVLQHTILISPWSLVELPCTAENDMIYP